MPAFMSLRENTRRARPGQRRDAGGAGDRCGAGVEGDGVLSGPSTHKIQPNVRFAPKAIELLRVSDLTLCAINGLSAVRQSSLFDHLVGAGKQ
jgi:hypothetical protein